MMVPNSFPIFHLVLNRNLALKNITAKMVSCAIYDLDAYKATGPDRMCSPQFMPVLAKLYNKFLAKSFFLPVGNLHPRNVVAMR